LATELSTFMGNRPVTASIHPRGDGPVAGPKGDRGAARRFAVTHPWYVQAERRTAIFRRREEGDDGR